MAVPNNYIDKIKKDGDSRMISPAADMVRVDNDNFEGSDLDEVLDEVAQAIEDAGEGGYAPPSGGIPKADLADDVQTSLGKADTALQSYTETDPTVPSWAKQPTKPTYTAQEVGALPANTPIPSKTSDLTNDSGFITEDDIPEGTVVEPATAAPSMDGTAAVGSSAKYAREDHVHPHDTSKQDTISDLATIRTGAAAGATAVQPADMSAAIQEAVEDLGGGTVESVTVGGTKHLPDVNGDVDLGNLRGQDGNSGVASADGVESVNNLNGGTTDTSSRVYVLGANQGKRLRDQIDYVYARLQAVYAALGNIAFWDGKTPIANILPDLDWGAPKHTVTLALSLTNAVVKHNGVAKSNGDTILVEEGGTLTLIVEPADGYALTSVSYVKDGGSSTSATSIGDGTYKIEFIMGGSDVALTVSGTAQQAYGVTVHRTNCTLMSGPTSVVSGGTATFVFAAASGYTLPSASPTVVGATVAATNGWTLSNNDTTGTLVIDNVTGDVTITIAAVQSFTGTINVKKITAWPSIDNKGDVTPVQGGESDYDMTIVDDNTIACSVDGEWKINIPNGYGLFSAVLKSNGTDVSEKIDFSTLTIDSSSLTGALTLDLVVAEATDGMFLGKSFHHSEGVPVTDPGNFIAGGVPVNTSSPNDDWCCMSEFVKAPTGVTNIKLEFGSILSSATTTNQIQNKRGCIITYSNKGAALGHFTIWEGGTTQRTLTFPPNDSPNSVYVRASFIENKLGVSAISFSTDGGTTWTKYFDGSTKDITTT